MRLERDYGGQENLKGGKMRQRNQITIALASGGILVALVFPWTLAALEDKFIDCRERPCDVEEIVRALQPPTEQTPQSSTMQYRGIPTTALPAAAIPKVPPPKTAVALNIYFATNSDRIAPRYYAELNKFGEALTRLPSTVEISGHTDSIGSDQFNQVLSERRAQSVKYYLEQRFSLPAERLIAKGYGEGRPRASNETESGRQQNRRIEVALPQP
jgi:outer membrane protein OmpA-like peptidoglycan-associated protein